MKWISVKDGLPTSVANRVIFCCKNGYVGVGHYEKFDEVCTWYSFEHNKPLISWCDITHWRSNEEDDYDVIYWMPLPKPKREE